MRMPWSFSISRPRSARRGCFVGRLPDMANPGRDSAEGCLERLDLEFLRYVVAFRRRYRPRIMELLDVYPDIPLFHARKPRDADRILALLGDRFPCDPPLTPARPPSP